MSPILPVPSKGALRALRHLALGTSCTVAFATGLLTEDIRRRIHVAREIQENGRRIKTSRTYHNSGTLIIAALEEAIVSGEYQPWESADTTRKPRLKWTNQDEDTVIGELPKQRRASQETNPTSSVRSAPSIARSDLARQMHDAKLWMPQKLLSAQKVESNTTTDAIGQPNIKIQTRQQTLENDLAKILDGADKVEMVDAAIARILDDFADGLPTEELGDDLLEVCVWLSDICLKYNKIAEFTPILIQLLSIGPVEEKLFYSLNTLNYIDRLIVDSKINSEQSSPDLQRVADAANLYITKLRNKPCRLNPLTTEIGERLCAATLKAKLYDLTHAVYWRMASTRGTANVKCVDQLILANRGRQFHKEAIKDFHRLFKKTQPDQVQFYTVGNAVLDSAIELGQLGQAEKFVFAATEMARVGGIITSTTWLLKLLGEHWRTNNDLSSTESLFDRIEPLLDYSSHPQALYSAIIQFCVEAGHEDRARQYLERFDQSGGQLGLDIRVQGHFALAKAMRHDWEGVKADFCLMDNSAMDFETQQAAIFAPIFKIFASSQSVSDTENFVSYFCDVLQLRPNEYISNIMIGKYAKAQEIDCIPTWIDYVRQRGVQINSTTFNIILISLRDKWLMRFTDLQRISKELQAADESMIDEDTQNILRSTAVMQGVRQSPQDAELAQRLSALPPSQDTNHGLTLDHAMRNALARGRPGEALDLYYTATSENETSVKPGLVALAVTASIRHSAPVDLDKVFELIKDAGDRGCDISVALTPLLLYQVNQIDSVADDADAVKAMVAATISNLKQRGLHLPIAVATTVATKLINRHESEAAIQVLTAALADNEASRNTIDIVTLTVFLRAYIDRADCKGVHWVMTLMSDNHIIADKPFKLVLKNGRREARRAAENRPDDNEAQRRYRILEESFQIVMDGRARTFAMQKKAVATTLRIMETASILHARQTTAQEISPERVADGSYDVSSKSSISATGRVGPLESLPLRWRESHEEAYHSPDMGPPLVGSAVA